MKRTTKLILALAANNNFRVIFTTIATLLEMLDDLGAPESFKFRTKLENVPLHSIGRDLVSEVIYAYKSECNDYDIEPFGDIFISCTGVIYIDKIVVSNEESADKIIEFFESYNIILSTKFVIERVLKET